jgi:hypothetical protein
MRLLADVTRQVDGPTSRCSEAPKGGRSLWDPKAFLMPAVFVGVLALEGAFN